MKKLLAALLAMMLIVACAVPPWRTKALSPIGPSTML